MTRPTHIPLDIWNAAFRVGEFVLRNLDETDVTVEVTAIAQAILSDRSLTLTRLREPPRYVTDAMAAARKAAEGRNGHGNHAYRDMWIAGIDAAWIEVNA